jgi:site-specific recombinase XerD
MSEAIEAYETHLKKRESRKTGERRRNGTLTTYAHSFRRLQQWFSTERGNPEIAAVRPEDVAAYLDWARARRTARNHDAARGRSERTVGRDWVLLHDLFEHALDLQWFDGRNPVAKRLRPVPGATRKPVMLIDAEVGQLITACGTNEQLRTFIMTQDAIGARPGSETTWLQWDDIDFTRAQLTFRELPDHRLKTPASVRTVPIPAKVVDQLRRLMDWYLDRGVESPWVFANIGRNGEGQPGERLPALQGSLRRLAIQVLPANRAPTCPKDSGKLHDLRGHDFRHRVAKRHKDKKFSLELRQEFLGHATSSQTDAYAGKADPEALRDMVTD